jgi:hypothetical protein
VISNFKCTVQESFVALLDLLNICGAHSTSPFWFAERILGQLSDKDYYFFEYLSPPDGAQNPDHRVLLSMIPVMDNYRIIKDNDMRQAYLVPRDLLTSLVSEELIEFYLLPATGSDWIYISTDGYLHCDSMILRMPLTS